MRSVDHGFVAFRATKPILLKLETIKGWTGGKSTSAVLRALILTAKREQLPSSWLIDVPDHERDLVALAEGRGA